MTRKLIGLVALALCAPTAAIAQTPPGTDDGDYEQIPVGGEVPATLSLDLGPAATFGAFAAGVTQTYATSMSATVISTAGDALLSVTDPGSLAAGHLVNGTFSLPQALQAQANSGAFAAVSGAPTTLWSWSTPIANDPVTIGFKQSIGANDALRTGSYGKTLTFTLSTTTP